MSGRTGKPRTGALLATLSRGPRSRVTVSIDEGTDGSTYCALTRFMLGSQGAWVPMKGFALLPSELRAAADAIYEAAERLGAEP